MKRFFSLLLLMSVTTFAENHTGILECLSDSEKTKFFEHYQNDDLTISITQFNPGSESDDTWLGNPNIKEFYFEVDLVANLCKRNGKCKVQKQNIEFKMGRYFVNREYSTSKNFTIPLKALINFAQSTPHKKQKEFKIVFGITEMDSFSSDEEYDFGGGPTFHDICNQVKHHVNNIRLTKNFRGWSFGTGSSIKIKTFITSSQY